MIKYQIKKLENGLTYVEAPTESTEAVTIFILVGSGVRNETAQNNGISHYLEHLFFKGTKKRPTPLDIAKELDSLGANYNAFTGEEFTGFYIQCDARDFEKSFDILSDMFLNPTFLKDEMEREKDVICEEIKMHRDVPQTHVQRLSQKQVFGDTPLGRDLAGTSENVKSFTRDEVIKFHQESYDPAKTYVVVCGNPKEFNWQKAVEDRFSSLKKIENKHFEPFKNSKIAQKYIGEVRKVDQAHLAFACLGLSKTDPRRNALAILTTLLGSGMSSRLFSEIREKRGWAYYVEAAIWALHDTGMFEVVAGVQTDKVADSIKVILDQLENIKTNGPTDEELELAKGNLRGRLTIGLEDSTEIAEFLAEDLIYFNRVRSIDEIIEGWNKVTKQDIMLLAEELFQKDKIGVAVIGPKDYKNEIEKILSYVEASWKKNQNLNRKEL